MSSWHTPCAYSSTGKPSLMAAAFVIVEETKFVEAVHHTDEINLSAASRVEVDRAADAERIVHRIFRFWFRSTLIDVPTYGDDAILRLPASNTQLPSA